jgi:phosphatidylglycerol---prolipoprotein diacylglyceryl transferase
MQAISEITINIDPTLVRLAFSQITWHGLFTAVGTLVGVWLAVRWAGRVWGVVGAIVGARLFHVVDQWDYYSQHLVQIVLINEGGIAIYGAIAGGVLAGAVYAWRQGLNIARLADVACIPLVLGMAIGRIR